MWIRTMDGKEAAPQSHDILCGRGKTYHNHRGNQRFRALIAVHIPKYADADTSRKQKTRIVQNIVQELYSEGCRFLKHDSKSSLWLDVGFHKAKQKVGHALRDATAEMNRSLHRANRTHSSSSSSASASSVPSSAIPGQQDNLPLVKRDMVDNGTATSEQGIPKRKATKSPPDSKRGCVKSYEDASSSDSDSGLFPASEFIKYADIEPISIASLSLGSQTPQLDNPQTERISTSTAPFSGEKEEALGSIPPTREDALFFSSILDMLNEASNVAGKSSRSL